VKEDKKAHPFIKKIDDDLNKYKKAKMRLVPNKSRNIGVKIG